MRTRGSKDSVGKPCSGCGCQISNRSKLGYCQTCLDVHVPLLCGVCGEYRDVYREHALRRPDSICLKCALAKATAKAAANRADKPLYTTVTCPKCNQTRQLKTSTIGTYMSNGGIPGCNMCRDRQLAKNNILRAIPGPNQISVNGCVLKRTKKAHRCKAYIHCKHGSHANLNGVPRKDDCCFRVALLGWQGWRTVGKCHPVIVEMIESKLPEFSLHRQMETML